LDAGFFEAVDPMKKKQKSIVTLSALPVRAMTDKQTQVRLGWDKRALRSRIEFALSLCCERPVVFHIEFVDALQIATLNWQFRGKDSPTDVLSFPPNAELVRPHQVQEPENLGELAVCIDVCLEQARKHKITPAQEVEKMILHGLVHLKGFDHERSDSAHAVMTSLERSIRNQVVEHFGAPDFCVPVMGDRAKKSNKATAKGSK
jgi:probable rRNA maturation factor